MKAIRGNFLTPIGIVEGQIEFNKEITYMGVTRAFEGELLEYGDALIAPGFIDIHVHGLGGYGAMDQDPNSLNEISKKLASKGVTSFLATLQTAPKEETLTSLRRIRNTETSGARLLGSHLEGPFISSEKIGAQDDYIREPDQRELKELLEAADGSLRLVTLAPEVNGCIEAVEYLAGRGVVVSAGHTNATYSTAKRGFEAGVILLGHTWNGMRGLHHREPGIIGAGFEAENVYMELIADTYHVHPSVLGITVKLKGAEQVILVSDSIKPAGLDQGKHVLDDKVYLVRDGLVRLESGVIAGSSIGLIDAVKNMVEKAGVTKPEALRMASYTPAMLLGLYKGRLEIGYDADLVVLDGFKVVETIVEGKTFYRAE